MRTKAGWNAACGSALSREVAARDGRRPRLATPDTPALTLDAPLRPLWARGLRRRTAIPGFAPTLGFTVLALSLIVLIPLAALVVRAVGLTPEGFAKVAFGQRALHAYALSFGAAFVAAAVNGVFGVLIAWALVRVRFPGRTLVGGLVDLPFALPTAVAGVALAALYGPNGWVGAQLAAIGIKAAFTPLGVVIALIFVGLPFVVRTVEPVLRDLSIESEEAARSLGAGRWNTLRRVIAPALLPAWLTGLALAFARGVGEYGSVIFIAGNMPYRSEIAPLLITIELEQFDYATASAVALVMLVAAFACLLAVNAAQAWARRWS